MTLFNSANPRIAALQATVIETLTSIPDEYGAVFVVDEYQAELMAAVRAHTRQQAIHATAIKLNRPGRHGRKRTAQVIDFTTKARVA